MDELGIASNQSNSIGTDLNNAYNNAASFISNTFNSTTDAISNFIGAGSSDTQSAYNSAAESDARLMAKASKEGLTTKAGATTMTASFAQGATNVRGGSPLTNQIKLSNNKSTIIDTDQYVIGKIPGYNELVDADQTYLNHKLVSYNTIDFIPASYTINISQFLPGGSADTANEIYKYESGASSQGQLMWQHIIAVNKAKLGDGLAGISSAPQKIRIIATTDSAITEDLSNSFGSSILQQNVDSFQNNNGGSLAGKALNIGKHLSTIGAGLDSTYPYQAMNMLQTDTLSDLVASLAMGMKVNLPQTWQASSYNLTQRLAIRLISPYGHPTAIRKYITEPLLLMILMASPITIDGVSYGYPPLWKVQSKGLGEISLGFIQNLNIMRGGADLAFNVHSQPMIIDVALSIGLITPGFGATINNSIDYEQTFSNTPQNIYKSLQPYSLLQGIQENGS